MSGKSGSGDHFDWRSDLGLTYRMTEQIQSGEELKRAT